MDWKGKLKIGFDFGLIILVLVSFALRQHEFYVAVSLLGLFPVAISAIKSLKNRSVSIDLLASVALVFSFLAGEWISAAFINLMLSFARIFDGWTEMRTKNIISHLLKFRPEKVKIKDGEHVKIISLEKIRVGDLVLVESGDRMPADGIVVSGQASIDESTLTGESFPVTKKVGKSVYSSTMNVSGSLLVRVEKIGADSTLEKIIALVDEASRKKSPTEKVAGKFTAFYIFTMLVGSLTVYLVFGNLTMVLSILLVVCADDLAVAVPLAFTSAIVTAARRGIIIKGSEVLEKLPRIRYILTDKTGTLTRGRPAIYEIKYFGTRNKEKFMETLGAAAVTSEHPVDTAICDYLKTNNVHIDVPQKFNETPGEGVVAVIGKNKVIAGRTEFLKSHKVTGILQNEIDHYVDKGYGVTAVAINGRFAGMVVFADEIRPFAREVVAETKKLGVKKWLLLTGDNDRVAARVASEVNIDEYRSNLKPEDKLKILEKLKSNNEIIAMVGDGVNDAATLAQADVSFAMGAIGADSSIEAADVALMNDRLERIPEAMILAKRTNTVIYQCFVGWLITNAVGLLLVFTGHLNPAGAAAYNFITDFIPIFNALRINTMKTSVYND